MNIYYLRKFRKKAQKEFRVRYTMSAPHFEIYGKGRTTEWYPTLDSAKKRLAERRRSFILYEVEFYKTIKSRIEYRKLNKQLAKL